MNVLIVMVLLSPGNESIMASNGVWGVRGNIPTIECEGVRLKSLGIKGSDYYTHTSCCLFPSFNKYPSPQSFKKSQLTSQIIGGIIGGIAGWWVYSTPGAMLVVLGIPEGLYLWAAGASIGTALGTGVGVWTAGNNVGVKKGSLSKTLIGSALGTGIGISVWALALIGTPDIRLNFQSAGIFSIGPPLLVGVGGGIIGYRLSL